MFYRSIAFAVVVAVFGAIAVLAQDGAAKEEKAETVPANIDLSKEKTDGIQIAESAIIVYSGLTGRPGLNQVRKTTVEIGKITYLDPDGTKRNADYVKTIVRGDSYGEEKIRFDQKFPNAEYAMVYDGGKIFGVISNTVFSPRDDAETTFRNKIVRGVDALLRYKENGSQVELKDSTKLMGVDYYEVKMTDKAGRETTYFVSKKSLRVLLLRYSENGVDYERRFYDHNYAQGTLVPYRTVLKANGKLIEEANISTITFGQSVEDSLFVFKEA